MVDIVEIFGPRMYTAPEQVLAQSLVKRALLYLTRPVRWGYWQYIQ